MQKKRVPDRSRGGASISLLILKSVCYSPTHMRAKPWSWECWLSVYGVIHDVPLKTKSVGTKNNDIHNI